jgi:hypothetical protein
MALVFEALDWLSVAVSCVSSLRVSVVTDLIVADLSFADGLGAVMTVEGDPELGELADLELRDGIILRFSGAGVGVLSGTEEDWLSATSAASSGTS